MRFSILRDVLPRTRSPCIANYQIACALRVLRVFLVFSTLPRDVLPRTRSPCVAQVRSKRDYDEAALDALLPDTPFQESLRRIAEVRR